MELHYLSKVNTDCLKGLLAVSVMLHHFAQVADFRLNLLSYMLAPFGTLSVAAFFFLSGYGLMLSVNQKGQAYIHSFPRSRILPYYIICVALVMLSVVNSLVAQNETITLWLVLQSVTFGPDTIVAKGWYLQVSLLSYISFYLLYTMMPRAKGRAWVAMASVVLFCVVCRLYDFPQYYYQTIPVILLGAVWYKNRYVMDELLGKKWFVLMTAALFLCVMFLTKVMDRSGYFWNLAEVLLFIPILIAAVRYIKIENNLTRYLGSISFELYILHGMFMVLFRSKFMYISTDYLYFMVVAAATMICSNLAAPVIRKIYATFRAHI